MRALNILRLVEQRQRADDFCHSDREPLSELAVEGLEKATR